MSTENPFESVLENQALPESESDFYPDVEAAVETPSNRPIHPRYESSEGGIGA